MEKYGVKAKKPVGTAETDGKDKKSILSPKKKKTLFSAKKKNDVVRVRGAVDRPLLILVLILLCIGTTFVFSASYVYAQNKFGDSFHFVRRQLGWAAVSVVGMFLASMVDYRQIKRFSWPIFIGAYILLYATFLFPDINGAHRCISIGGFSLEPSEIVKFGLILVCSDYLVSLSQNHPDRLRSFRWGVLPFGILLVALAIPLYFQPHLSAMVILALLTFALMFLGGVKPAMLVGIGGTGAAGLAAMIFLTEHGRSRLNAWVHPEADLQGAGWQPLQSLYAVGSGGLWGVGLGQSNQKHLYLPEPQNDYIFAIICEEMGFVFAVCVIALFILLIWRGFTIAKNAPSLYSSMLVMGIMIQIALQVFLNIAVVTNFIPCTGVSLPFFSYGGSSLVFFMAEMGVVLNISRYSYLEKA